MIYLFFLSKVYALETEVGPVPGSGSALKEYIDLLYNTYLLPIGAVIAVAMIIYAGIKYTTSSGNPEQIAEAKDIFISTVVALAVLILGGLILALINPNA